MSESEEKRKLQIKLHCNCNQPIACTIQSSAQAKDVEWPYLDSQDEED